MSATGDPRTDDLIRAYLEERDAYVQRGMTDRAASVDVELRRLGYNRSLRRGKERAVPRRGETRG